MTKEQRNVYMCEYRQRPGIRERILTAQRQAYFWNREKNRARAKAYSRTPVGRRARQAWYVKNRDRILSVSKIKRDYAAKFGAPPKRYVITAEELAKSLRSGRDELGQLRKQLAESRKRAVATRRAHEPEFAKARKEGKIIRDYFTQFGSFTMTVTVRNLALMRKSLETGRDALAEPRRKQLEFEDAWPQREAERRARIEADRKAHPLAADDERRMTSLVKKRRLFEGACELPWADYFAFREVNKCERLTANDRRYLGQWTSCPI